MSFINIIKSKIKIKSSKINEPIFYPQKGLMKKLILSLIIGVTMAFSSFADEHDSSLRDLPGNWWEHFPAVCVPNETLWEYSQRKEFIDFKKI